MSERQMLLLAITKANLKPTSETWVAVASLLGNGLTPSAVRYDLLLMVKGCDADHSLTARNFTN